MTTSDAKEFFLNYNRVAGIITRPLGRNELFKGLDPETEIYGIQTDFRVSAWYVWGFQTMSSDILDHVYKMKPPGLVAHTFDISFDWSWANGLMASNDTFTFWEKPEDLAAFVRCPVHMEGRKKLSQAWPTLASGTYRDFWVKVSDLPQPGDYFGTRDFVTRIKQNEFRPAHKTKKTQ
eukprot:Clim_evm85s142 gene=Clim_evmTU85s142